MCLRKPDDDEPSLEQIHVTDVGPARTLDVCEKGGVSSENAYPYYQILRENKVLNIYSVMPCALGHNDHIAISPRPLSCRVL